MKLLFSAEPYGYGPAAKAVAIARTLHAQGHSISFVGSGTALHFAQGAADTFDTCLDEHLVDYSGLLQLNFNAAVSVMEPSLTVAAHAVGLPSVYVDSLYWMWNWADNDSQRLRAVVEHIAQLPVDSALEALATEDMHDGQFVAHRLATRLLVQRSFESNQSGLRSLMTPTMIGPVVEKCPTSEPYKGPIVASISGMLSSLVDMHLALPWAQAVVDLLHDGYLNSNLTCGIIVQGNPAVLSNLRSPASSHFQISPAADHVEAMERLANAPISLAPPGITSILEAWQHSVPFVALPAQHYAHGEIFERVSGGDTVAFPGMSDSRLASARSNRTDETRDVLDLSVRRLTGESRTVEVARLSEILTSVGRSPRLWAEAQGKILSRAFGTSDGTAEAADVILSVGCDAARV